MVKPNLSIEKNKKANMKHKYLYFFMYVYIILLMIITNMYIEGLDFLDSSNSLHIQPSEINEDMSVYELMHSDDHVFNYTVDISGDHFKVLEGEEYRLIISGIQDNAIKVWFNDQLIISHGDIEKGLSVLRSAHVYGSIESSSILANNILRIQTYADYRTGISKPIVFSEKKDGDHAINLLDLLNERVITVGFGFMFITSIYIFIIYLLDRRGNRMLQFLSLATFFISFYFLDFLPQYHFHFDYIIMKRIFLLCLSLGTFFYGMTLYKLIQKKYIIVIPVFQLAYYVFTMIWSTNMVQFRSYYSYFYSSLALMVVFFLFVTLFHLKKNNRVYILFLHFTSMILLGVISVALGFSNSYFSVSMPVYIMLPVGVLPMLITIDLFLEKDLRVIHEKELKDAATNQSMIDDQTGVWNKRYLDNRIMNLHGNTVVAIIDLDNLKSINDTYGHLAGDRVICYMTETIRKHTRSSDDVCRYGGDEFVVIFYECSIKKAGHIVENIRKSIAEQAIRFNGSHIKTSISAGLCAVTDEVTGEQVLECADQQLYIAKENGKNRVEFEYLGW